MGLVGYYRRFVQEFLLIATPSTRLMQKNMSYVWNKECESSFNQLKQKLTMAPIVILLVGRRWFVIFIYESNVNIGCVLMENGKVIADGTRQLKEGNGTMKPMIWSWPL